MSAPTKSLTPPLLGTALLMLTYLLLRPYGDQAGTATLAAAEAFASWRWVVAHVAGALAPACIAWLAVLMHERRPSPTTRAARATSLVGVTFSMLYYGAETFALHALGRAAIDVDPSALALVDGIRDGAAAMTLFGVGLLLLAASAVLLALAWQREHSTWAAWPLGFLVVAFLPQFFLPAEGRMAYGVAYAVAAGIWLVSSRRADGAVRDPAPSPLPHPGVGGVR